MGTPGNCCTTCWNSNSSGSTPSFYDDTALYPDCFDPATGELPAPCDRGVALLGSFFSAYGLGERWSFWDVATGRWFGLGATDVAALLEATRLAVTLAPVTRVHPGPRAVRVFIDLDPGYTQFRLDQGDRVLRELLASCHRHFTIGERIPLDHSGVPHGGFHWLPTQQPIVTQLWAASSPPPGAPFTTVGRWHEPAP